MSPVAFWIFAIPMIFGFGVSQYWHRREGEWALKMEATGIMMMLFAVGVLVGHGLAA